MNGTHIGIVIGVVGLIIGAISVLLALKFRPRAILTLKTIHKESVVNGTLIDLAKSFVVSTNEGEILHGDVVMIHYRITYAGHQEAGVKDGKAKPTLMIPEPLRFLRADVTNRAKGVEVELQVGASGRIIEIGFSSLENDDWFEFCVYVLGDIKPREVICNGRGSGMKFRQA